MKIMLFRTVALVHNSLVRHMSFKKSLQNKCIRPMHTCINIMSYTAARWFLWLITQTKQVTSLLCNHSVIITDIPTLVIALWLSYLHCGELFAL